MNGRISSALSSAFEELYDFGRAQGPIPSLICFWRETFAQERRLLLSGPVGSRAEAVFGALTGALLEEDRLRQQICEARPDPEVGNNLEAMTVLAGRPFAGGLVSVAIQSVTGMDPGSMRVADWLERVSLVAVVSPAPAVLGKAEIELMEGLVREGRDFCVVVTRVEGVTEEERADFRSEIEAFKVGPLHDELGPFEVFYVAVAGEEAPDLRKGLEYWVGSRLEESHFDQLHRIVARWTAEMKRALEARAIEEHKIQTRLDFLTGHLEDQVERLRDLVSQERMAVENWILEAVETLEKASDAAPLDGRLNRVWIAWDELAVRFAAAPSELTERLRVRFAGQIREFCAAYRDLLPAFEFDEREGLSSPVVHRPHLPDAAELRSRIEQRLAREETLQSEEAPDARFFRSLPRSQSRHSLERPASELATVLSDEVDRRARSEARARLSELESDHGLRLATEAETVLRKLDRHVRMHVQEKRASLRATGLRARLEELGAAWDRAVSAVHPSPRRP